jgi:predicted DNA-binding protein
VYYYTLKGDEGMARPKVEEGKKCIRKDISMEPDQYRRLCEYCQKTERPLSWVVRRALEEYLKNVV